MSDGASCNQGGQQQLAFSDDLSLAGNATYEHNAPKDQVESS